MTIANNIDRAMHIAHIKTQAALSRKSGVPESSVARILKGLVLPSIDNLSRIAKACNTTMDALVLGTLPDNTGIAAFPLVYVTQEELMLLTQFREASAMGKNLIKTAADTAEKESSPELTDET